MAEAPDPPIDAVNQNYFCHHCAREITPKFPDYVCPQCDRGFIERLESTEDSDSDTPNESEAQLMRLLTAFDSRQPATGSQERPHLVRPPRLRRGQGQRSVGLPFPNALLPLLHEMIPRHIHDVNMMPAAIEVTHLPFLVAPSLASNPADYAWGRGGLDTIITQLMNQSEACGPAPLPEDKIKQIPIVKITQEQCDKNLQCSVCMEDFVLNDDVRKLSCEHCYHEQCILPWLELHGTCPVCRLELNSSSQQNSGPNHRDNPRSRWNLF